ncbi:MAG TPA: WD40 repeat domain-containing protein [Candidatus Babeliales bacterium]|nr:WD40 repeat domain-containing protein [Candidatus Babeliales bacterium]
MKVNKIYLLLWSVLLLPLAIESASQGPKEPNWQEALRASASRRQRAASQDEEEPQGPEVAAAAQAAEEEAKEEETKETENNFEAYKAAQERLRREREIAEFNRATQQDLAAQNIEEAELQEAIEASVAEAEKSSRSAKTSAATAAAAQEEEIKEGVVKKQRKKTRMGEVGRNVELFLPKELAGIVEEYAQGTVFDPLIPLRSITLLHQTPVYAVTVSADNKFIVTVDWNTIALWNAQTRQLQRTIVIDNLLWLDSGLIWAVAISSDNKFIVTGSSDKTARIWDVETGRQLRVLTGHTSRITSVAISSDNKFIVTGSEDYTARIWDVETGRQLRVLTGHTHSIQSVAISSDNKFIVTGAWDGTVLIWDVETGKQLSQIAARDPAVISSDGKFIVAASSGSNSAAIWDIETGEQLRVFEGYIHSITSVAISSDDKFIVTGFADATVRILDVETGAQLHLLAPGGHRMGQIGISTEGQFIVAAFWDNAVRVWTPDSREAMLYRAQEMRAAAERMLFFPQAELDEINQGIQYLESAAGMAASPRELETRYQRIDNAFSKGRQVVVGEAAMAPAADLGLGGMPGY